MGEEGRDSHPRVRFKVPWVLWLKVIIIPGEGGWVMISVWGSIRPMLLR